MTVPLFVDGGGRMGTNASRLAGYFIHHEEMAESMPTSIGGALGKTADMHGDTFYQYGYGQAIGSGVNDVLSLIVTGGSVGALNDAINNTSFTTVDIYASFYPAFVIGQYDNFAPLKDIKNKIMYIVNDAAIKRDKFVKKNLFQIFFFGFPMIGFTYFLAYVSHNGDKNGTLFFLSTILPFGILYLIFSIYVTLRMMKKWNNTIKTMDFQNGKMIASTFDILWLKSKVYSKPTTEVKSRQSIFEWYGKGKTEGTIVELGVNDDLYLVKNYFDEYDEMLAVLKNPYF